jgi:hypothetical protein
MRHATRWLSTSLLALNCGFLPARGLDGEGEEAEIKGVGKSSAAAFNLAMKSKSDSVSAAAYGMFLKASRTSEPGELAGKIKTFSEREGMLYRAMAIASYHPDANKISQALADGRAYELAAGMALWKAKAHYLQAKVQADRARLLNGIGVETTTKKRRKSPAIVTVPAALFKVKVPGIQERAILAAAYGGAGEHKETIRAIKPKTPGVYAARALFLSMQGESFTTNDVMQIAAPLLKASKPMTQINAHTTSWNPLAVPGCAFVEALGISGDTAYLPVLHKALFHPDIRIQTDAVRAIKAIDSEESLPILARRLGDCSWPVAVEICDTISRMPDKRIIGPLINRLGKERGRIRQDLVFALSVIAGEQKAETPKGWASWFHKEGPGFEVDTAASKTFRDEHLTAYTSVPSYGYFYGIKIYSDRFCFVVDTSASMRGARIADLRSNMTECLNSLRGNPAYNIVDFGGDVVTMYAGTLTDDRAIGLKRVEEMPLTYATRSFDAMERACQLNAVDTLIFLSDGAPIRGQIDSWAHIRSALTLMNIYRPMAIQSIDFDPSPGNMENMRLLGLENKGQHMSVEVGLDPNAGQKKPKKKKK